MSVHRGNDVNDTRAWLIDHMRIKIFTAEMKMKPFGKILKLISTEWFFSKFGHYNLIPNWEITMRDYFHRESRYIDLAFNIPITIRAFVPTTTCTKDSVRVTLTLCYLMLLHSEPVQSCNNHVNKQVDWRLYIGWLILPYLSVHKMPWDHLGLIIFWGPLLRLTKI